MIGIRRAHLMIFRLLLATVLGISATAALAEQVKDLPQPTDYVSDDAHVLSPEAIARLDRICGQLDHSAANAQIAVVTIHTLDGDDAADYANQLEDKWKMGRKGTDRGLLVFLAVDDHKYRIEPGYGLEGILPDGKVGDIGREMVPYLRAGDYDGAITAAVGEVAQVIAADAKVTLDDQPIEQQAAPRRHSTGIGILHIIIFLIVVLFFLFRVLGSWGLFGLWGMSMMGRGGGYGGGGGGFGGGGGDSGGGGGFGGFGGGGFGGGGAGGSW
jgi:uncharacterized protein